MEPEKHFIQFLDIKVFYKGSWKHKYWFVPLILQVLDSVRILSGKYLVINIHNIDKSVLSQKYTKTVQKQTPRQQSGCVYVESRYLV